VKFSASRFKATGMIDLTNFTFGASLKHFFIENKAKTKGVLTITDGTLRASVTLFGQYVAAGFHFAKDGAGRRLPKVRRPAACIPIWRRATLGLRIWDSLPHISAIMGR
jgi:hypothetical protein